MKLRKIAQLQMQSDKIRQIKEKLERDEGASIHSHYQLIGNKWHRKWKNQWKLYIPDELRDELVEKIHRMYGHPGTKKTLKLVREYFTMDSMCKTISKLIRCCDVCQRCKDGGNIYITGETRPIIPTRKGEMVSLDFYGPLLFQRLE